MRHFLWFVVSLAVGLILANAIYLILTSTYHWGIGPMSVVWLAASSLSGLIYGWLLKTASGLSIRARAVAASVLGLSIVFFAPANTRAGGDLLIPALSGVSCLPVSIVATLVASRKKEQPSELSL